MQIAALLGLPFVTAAALMAQAPKQPQLAVVVEEVGKDSATEKAGVKRGDILVSWERAANPPANPDRAHGDFRSPFDARQVEIEQAPRGQVTLTLARDKNRILLMQTGGEWHLTTRPAFSQGVLSSYDQALKPSGATRTQRVVADLGSLAATRARAGHHLDAAWLLSRVAQTLEKAKRSDEAAKAYDGAIREAELGDDWQAQAQLWSSRGRLFDQDDKYPAAIESYAHAIKVTEAHVPNSLALAKALGSLGQAERKSGNVEKAIELHERALTLQGEFAPDSLDVASSLSSLSVLARIRGDVGKAQSLATRALSIQERLAPDSLDVAQTLNNLGNIASDEREAERYHRRALAIRQRLAPCSEEVAASLNNLAIAVGEQGDLAAVDTLFLQALEIDDPNSLGASVTLMNLGRNAHERGDLILAESYYRSALAIQERLAPEGLDLALTLINAGELASDHDPDSAESFYWRALAIREKAGSSGSIAFLRLGDLALQRGHPAAAEDFFHRAQASLGKRSPFGVAMIELRLGNLALQRGDIAAAEKLLTQSASTLERSGPSTISAANAFYALANLYRSTARKGKAVPLMLRALDILELLRHQQGRSHEASDYEFYLSYYRECTELLEELGRSEEAFEILERSKAMSLLAILAERDLVLEADLPSELVRRRKEMVTSHDEKESELANLNPQKDAQQADVLRTELRELDGKRSQIVEEIKKASPRYGALQYPRPLDLPETRAALYPGTLLLSYSVGKEKSFLFVVSPEPKRRPMLSVFTLQAGENALRESVQAFRRLIDWNRPSPELLARGRALYDMLLKPAEALIAGSDRVLILPDGPLHTMPWGALVQDVKGGQPQYLVERKSLHTAVSVTVYAELKKARHQTTSPASIEVASFGDPKYPKLLEKKLVAVKRGEDEEVGESLPGNEFDDVEDPQVRSVARGGFRFEPLPASRAEVETIASLYSPRSVAYLGPDATEEQAKSLGKEIPLIHFACHAVINERFPLDSALVFTIPEYPKEGQDNGLLQAWEIFERMRIDADLVTLSACDSGLGKEMGGEGLIGLTRAFQYAGARTVLASLWKVEDKATGELMKRFYTYLKSGKTKDEALRLAQIDLIHSADFSQPKDWAAFQLNGDWR